MKCLFRHSEITSLEQHSNLIFSIETKPCISSKQQQRRYSMTKQSISDCLQMVSKEERSDCKITWQIFIICHVFEPTIPR